jgi:hypothetical protein
MPALRGALLFIGILATIVGLIWLGEDLHAVPFTSDDTVAKKPWPYRGIALAVAGIFSIILSRRIPKQH